MGIDLTKMTPLPQKFFDQDGFMYVGRADTGFPVMISELDNRADLEFWLLARRVFAIMQRRGPDFFLLLRSQTDGKIIVDCPSHGWIPGRWDDAFSAWCDSEDWYAAHVEGKTNE